MSLFYREHDDADLRAEVMAERRRVAAEPVLCAINRKATCQRPDLCAQEGFCGGTGEPMPNGEQT